MKNSSKLWKSLLAKVLVVVMVTLSFIVPTTEANASAAPKISKSTINVLIGKQYNLNVLNKIKGSTYAWTTNNKEVATVTNRGVVTGVDKGTAVITCKVKTAKKVYTLKAKVTVILPVTKIKITNKITAINFGKSYDLNRILIPADSNEKTYWSSSDKSIASPDKYGKFTAKKLGTVTITATTTTGKTDSVTIKVIDPTGVVTTQEDLDSLLASGAPLVTLKTDKEVNITIKAGDYSNTKLVVDAPKADITNYGKFASIEIRQIKADTWREEAVGNLLAIFAQKSRVIVGTAAQCNIEVDEKGATLYIVNNGVIEKVTISKEAAQASLDFKGSSKQDVPVVVNTPGVQITTSVPLNMQCEQKVILSILPGAEKTQVTAKTQDAVPEVKGSVTLQVKVGTGTDVATVVGTPLPTGTPTPTPGSGGPGGNNTQTSYIGIVTTDGKGTYTLPASYKKLKSITVTYGILSVNVDETTMSFLKSCLAAEQTKLDVWKNTTNTTKTYNGQSVTVTGNKGEYNKTVTFPAGTLVGGKDGRSYTVTVDPSNGSVTVTNPNTKNSYTVAKGSDEKTLTISSAPTGLSFTNALFEY